MPLVYIARLVCSDEACAEEVTHETATLAELETLLCECGCALEVIGWPDVAAEPLAEVIMLRVQAASAAKRRALDEAA
jgi:hypothetical protein